MDLGLRIIAVSGGDQAGDRQQLGLSRVVSMLQRMQRVERAADPGEGRREVAAELMHIRDPATHARFGLTVATGPGQAQRRIQLLEPRSYCPVFASSSPKRVVICSRCSPAAGVFSPSKRSRRL